MKSLSVSFLSPVILPILALLNTRLNVFIASSNIFSRCTTNKTRLGLNCLTSKADK